MQILEKIQYNLAKKFGKRVKYKASWGMDLMTTPKGVGEVAFSKRPLCGEWYGSCCGTILFLNNWASLSHRNLENEIGYDTMQDIEESLRTLVDNSNGNKNGISGFAIGGNSDHIDEIFDSFNDLGINLLNKKQYVYDNPRGLVIIPRTRRVILSEILSPLNKNSKRKYTILN